MANFTVSVIPFIHSCILLGLFTVSKPKKSYIVHSTPQRVKDIFPLALTYMSEPKIASARRIKQYLEDYYDFNNDNR